MSKPPIIVDYAVFFTRLLRHLKKSYRHVERDIKPLVGQLENGETPGDQIQGVKYPVYKVRVRNSDVPKGKSGGYRVVYYVRTADRIILLFIYAKTQRLDISPDEIRRIIEDYEANG